VNKLLFSVCFVLVVVSAMGQAIDESFYAYYTSINLGEDFEKHSRTGGYADIVIVLNQELKVVFWRGSSYLPYVQSGDNKWFLDEIVPRSGDGDSEMPDRLNRYSYVRLIESSDEKIVVHWRYVPDFGNPTFTGVVDEYFTFTPDHKLVRTIRKGTETIDEWEDPASQIIQVLELSSSGITLLPVKTEMKKEMARFYEGGKLSNTKFGEHDLISLPFNEFKGSSTKELVSQKIVPVVGNKALWKKGVEGSCLQFDGYYSSVELPGYLSQDVQNEITVEGWITLGAYPFDWAPVIHQSTWEHSGFYLGIDQDGKAGFHVSIDSEWHSVISESKLELFRWYYLAGLVNNLGEIKLFIDGLNVKTSTVDKGTITLSNTDLMIGMNREKMPAIVGRISKGKYPSLFGIDGLIDGVMISGKAKDPSEILEAFQISGLTVPDMEPRHWPVMLDESPGKFGAQYTRLKYYETWDNMWRVSDHPDVVVSFDELPGKIISWRGLSSGPVFVTENNLWVGDQSSENYKELGADEAEGCCEHMSDKQCRHAHIRIIENTDARVVLHYRYGMVDSRYIFPDVDPNTGWGDWADEIWTIYPDGVAVRHLERGMIWGDSWVETLIFMAPGTKPEDVVELEAYTAVNEEEEMETWSWINGSPEKEMHGIVISMVNSKSIYKPFNIYPAGSSVDVYDGGSRYSRFPWGNHWPVSQITSDGRGARASDRASHSSLVWGIPSEPFLMYGLTSKPANELRSLANSWNDPPKIKKLQGATSAGYEQNQRAYLLERQKDRFEFVLQGTESSPIMNFCFVIKNWNSDFHGNVVVDRNPEGTEDDIKQGIIRDTDGSRTLVIWAEMERVDEVHFEITE
jgi:hypothetical protein